MSPVQFRIGTLMGLIVFAGFGIAALSNANDLWASASYTLAIILIATAIVGIVARNGRMRMMYIGFTVFALANLLSAQLSLVGTSILQPVARPPFLTEHAAHLLWPFVRGSGQNHQEFMQVSNSLGIIAFGLIGAIVARFMPRSDERPVVPERSAAERR